MNDQHAHAGYVGYDGYPSGSFETDPLFGALPGHEAGHSGQYDSSQWDTGSHQAGTAGYDVYGAQHQAEQAQQFTEATGQYATVGQYDATGQYTTAQYDAGVQAGVPYDPSGQYDATGQWDASAWNQGAQTGQFETAAAAFTYDATGQWAVPGYETGTYDATAWNTGAEAVVPQQFTPEQEFGTELLPEFSGEYTPDHTQEYAEQYEPEATPGYDSAVEDVQNAQDTQYAPEYDTAYGSEFDTDHETEQHTDDSTAMDADSVEEPGDESELEPALIGAAPVTPRPVRRSGGSRGRRRTPAKRSALLTVAVPSACVMGVAGIAAASVSGISGGETKDNSTQNLAAADPASVKPAAANNKMDTQLAALSADARDFGDRASRTQERLDLKARQEAERKKRLEEAKRLEALRPKFVLPVKQGGLSAYYGQAGVNWMSLHSGIDFPVPYGTEVMAATDGTVRTQYNSAYGNMAIVTAADGTETWYCHLSTTKIRSGSVKAGDVIAYSGNSGNSTGPHLHFEVRPGGGAAIDPLPWLRSHGLDPA
ncbi:M23 family metallopeptidase [Streptomyces sp. AM8-1-1]|uniref:M23 family metallopeptidase n=1 Tax=Streptomyces sp. AM8-1-1 TaxID=3075825 RepID=UPI0028C45BB2|nr:M23 family metallopeptidase [Streptomyces sp. AM8-1-1]WNO72808.1 M23 family metallopeptidase [Streptomyces sp. AM8-1-1]